MCGIVGFIGAQQCAPILLDGLSKLEYRGYDSAGMAILNDHTGKIDIVKAKGRLKILAEKTELKSGDVITVAQIGTDNIPLGYTQEYVCP